MPRLLIADASGNFIKILSRTFGSDWEIHIAKDNTSIYDQLLSIHPNALLLNLDPADSTPTSSAAKHLDALGVRPNLSGYRCLLAAIQLLSQDHTLLLKEIYPEVAKQCGLNDAICVEHVIRTAIRDSWNHRNEDAWNSHFPGRTHCPSSKEFIATLAEML